MNADGQARESPTERTYSEQGKRHPVILDDRERPHDHNPKGKPERKEHGKVHILVAATGSVAAIKVPLIVKSLSTYENVEIQVIATQTSLRFFNSDELRQSGFKVWVDDDEWTMWTQMPDPILHIELRRWADVMLIAPMSANSLAKTALGLSDSLLSSVLRAWSSSTPILAAPAMNTNMWSHPLTQKHLSVLKEMPNFELIHPIEKVLACQDIGMGGMAEYGDCVGRVVKRMRLVKRQDSADTSQRPVEQEDDQVRSGDPYDGQPQAEELSDIKRTNSASMKQVNVDKQQSDAKSSRQMAVSMPDLTQHEEYQYLDLVRLILARGERRPDRTGTGTIALFAPPQLRFSLRNNAFPLLTTKRTFLRGIAEELLWFIRGDTNAKHLSDKDVHIWDGNGSRKFLDNLGLTHREEGDLGPVYGFQWRHFGAKYIDCHTDYTGQGTDQLADVIHKIKTNPFDRRIIMSAWNAADLTLMALPPCHVMCQFTVSHQTNELSCLLFQRSCDMGLGVPFNIASYALLLRMIAHVCDLPPGKPSKLESVWTDLKGDLIVLMGDCHVYTNHVDALKVQIEREPREFPKLHIPRKVDSIDGFKYEDFQVSDYNPHPRIKMDMAV